MDSRLRRTNGSRGIVVSKGKRQGGDFVRNVYFVKRMGKAAKAITQGGKEKKRGIEEYADIIPVRRKRRNGSF